MDEFTFFVDGLPRAKQSTQWSPRSKCYYTKPEIKNWQNRVNWYCLAKWRPRGLIPKTTAVILEATFIYFTRKKYALSWKLSKPDLCNLIKPIEDAMEGVIYENDSQIVQYQKIEKIFTNAWEKEEGVRIKLKFVS